MLQFSYSLLLFAEWANDTVSVHVLTMNNETGVEINPNSHALYRLRRRRIKGKLPSCIDSDYVVTGIT